MGNYEQLKQAISDVIKTNGNQEITGAILQKALLTIISTVGDGATFAGIATPTTNPGTPDQNLFYIATQKGTYSNFGGYVLENEVIIFSNNSGNWVSSIVGIPTNNRIEETEYPYIKISDSVTISKGTSSNRIYIQKSLFPKGRIQFTIDKSNFPQGINYLGCQIRNNNGQEITTQTQSEFYVNGFVSDGRFRIGFYFAGAVQTDVVIPFTIKVLYGSHYEEETRDLINNLEQKIIDREGAYYATRFNGNGNMFDVDFVARTIKTNICGIFIYDDRGKSKQGHGYYFNITQEKEENFLENGDPDTSLPWYLIYDVKYKGFRLCNYTYLNTIVTTYYIIGHGAINNNGNNFVINCNSGYSFNNESVQARNIDNNIASLTTMKSYAYNKAIVKIGETVSKSIYLGLKAQKGDIIKIKVISRNYQTEEINGIQFRDNSNEELSTNTGDDFYFVVKNDTSFIRAALYLKNEATNENYVEFISEIVNINSNDINQYYFNSGYIKNGYKYGGYGKINIPFKKGNKYILSLISKEIPDDDFLGLQVRNQYGEEITTTKGIAVLKISKDSSWFSANAYSSINVKSNKRFYFMLIEINNGINELNLYKWLEEYSNYLSDYNLKLEPRQYGIFKDFLDYKIIGTGKYITSIFDDKGDYDNPPIEIAGGLVQDLSIIQNGGKTEHSGYCIHTDKNQNKNKTLYINNCFLQSNSSSCIGCGTREGYNIIIDNCTFIYNGTNEESDASCWYSHNTSQSVEPNPDNPSNITFINCIFINTGLGKVMRIQDWARNTDRCVFTFINNTFIPSDGNIENSVVIEYRGYSGGDELDSHEFKNRMTLSNQSCGNNVSWLNYQY